MITINLIVRINIDISLCYFYYKYTKIYRHNIFNFRVIIEFKELSNHIIDIINQKLVILEF